MKTHVSDIYDYWLSSVHTVQNRRRLDAVRKAGSAQTLYGMDRKNLQELEGFTDRDIEELSCQRYRDHLETDWKKLKESDMSFISVMDKNYPARLKNIPDAPVGIFLRGHLPSEKRPAVAVVGARMCSEYGRKLACELGRRLSGLGVEVISGMALGIDSAAQNGALQEKGQTYAVLGCGADICYPKSSAVIYRALTQGRGGIISEYLPGTKPLPYFFPVRNRIISGLSDVLVIVEARERSGSLITADQALEQGRDIYAFPGRYDDALSRGCNRLIAQGAGIIYDMDMFLEEIQKMGPERCMENANQDAAADGRKGDFENSSLEKAERLVYSCFDLHPKNVMTIINETGLEFADILEILEHLKELSLIEETIPNYYVRKHI